MKRTFVARNLLMEASEVPKAKRFPPNKAGSSHPFECLTAARGQPNDENIGALVVQATNAACDAAKEAGCKTSLTALSIIPGTYYYIGMWCDEQCFRQEAIAEAEREGAANTQELFMFKTNSAWYIASTIFDDSDIVDDKCVFAWNEAPHQVWPETGWAVAHVKAKGKPVPLTVLPIVDHFDIVLRDLEACNAELEAHNKELLAENKQQVDHEVVRLSEAASSKDGRPPPDAMAKPHGGQLPRMAKLIAFYELGMWSEFEAAKDEFKWYSMPLRQAVNLQKKKVRDGK